MLEKSYRIIAHYPMGGTECFGDMATEDAAVERINMLYESSRSGDTHPRLMPCEYEIRIILKNYE